MCHITVTLNKHTFNYNNCGWCQSQATIHYLTFELYM